jgi:hypothetical protein
VTPLEYRMGLWERVWYIIAWSLMMAGWGLWFTRRFKPTGDPAPSA